MRRSEHTRILHVALQIPELLQPHPAHVHDIRGGHDGSLHVRPRELRAERHDKVEQVLVEGEQTQETLRHLGGLVRVCGGGGVVHGGVVFGHVFAVEVFDFEDVDGDAAAVAVAGPLGVLYPWS